MHQFELNSSYMEPWNNRGIAMVLGYEDVAGALQSFDRAIQIDPRSVEAWVNKANALDMADRGPEAQEAREKSSELSRRHEADRMLREQERKRKALEARIAALRADNVPLQNLSAQATTIGLNR